MMSLRLRLLAIIGLSLTALWSLVAFWMFLDMRQELRSALDDRLAASARMVAGLVSQLPPSAVVADGRGVPLLDVVARDGLACEVSLLRGEIIVQTMARTAGSPGLSDAPPGYGTHSFGGKDWRTYVLEQDGIRIATADRIDVRAALLRDIALSVGVPFAVALCGSLLLLWFGIGQGLAPIERIRAALAQRRPDDPGPLPETIAPPELRPLVTTLHQLLDKVRSMIERERRFTDDAAHELRTPLTAIKTHLQVARLASSRSGEGGLLCESLSSADLGVLRLQGTLDQLLMLARLDGQAAPADIACADAASAARQAMEAVGSAQDAGARLTLHGAQDAAVHVAMPEALLVVALRNLLDNALKHSPPPGPVHLLLEPAGQGWMGFSVRDEGPGLTPQECEQATQRFWRRGTGAQGCGLGLSIVRAIAERHGGALHLSPGRDRGLEVRLTVPICGEVHP